MARDRVLALWLYTLSAGPVQAPAGLADRLQLVLLVTAIVVDLVVLIAMAGRIAEMGPTTNRASARPSAGRVRSRTVPGH